MREGWAENKLGNLCVVLDNQRKPVAKINRNKGNYPYYGANGLLDYVDDYIFDGRYVLIGEDGANWDNNASSSYIVEGKTWVNNHAHVIKVNDLLNDEYLVYYLNYKDLNKFISGAIIKKLTQSSLKEITIEFPDKIYQEKIVKELNIISEMISKYDEQLKELDKLSQSIFYEMFGDPVENEKGWEVKKLGEITDICTGSTPNRNNEDYYEGSIPWVKSTEVCNCFINITEEHITEEAINETNCKLFPKGTILMAMYGQGRTRGQIAILNIDATTNQAVAAILPNSQYEKLFMFQHLLVMYEKIRSLARGGNQANLNLTLVKSIDIILPPLPLQQSFALKIEAIEAMKSKVREAKKEAETLLAARMQYWFE